MSTTATTMEKIKLDPDYQKLTDKEKDNLEKFASSVDGLSNAQRHKTAAYIALLCVVHAPASVPKEVKMDLIRRCIDFCFNAGQWNVNEGLLMLLEKTGNYPSKGAVIAGAMAIDAKLIKTMNEIGNLMELFRPTNETSQKENGG